MARTLASIEVWDKDRTARIQIPGTSGYDLIPHLAGRGWQVAERLGEVSRLKLEFKVGSSPVVAEPVYLARRRIVRLIYDDASFEEFRIQKTERELSGEGAPVLEAESLWGDLRTRIARQTLAGGTVDLAWARLRRTAADLLSEIMADAPAPFAAGSAGAFAAVEVSLAPRASTHAELLDQLVAEIRAESGLTCEWEPVYNSVSDEYEIDLVSEIGGAGVRPVEFGDGLRNNRIRLRRLQDATRYASRIVPLAGPEETPLTIARATWSVSAAVYNAGAGQTTLTLPGEPIWVDGCPFGGGVAGQFGNDTDGFFAVVSTTAPGTVVVTGDASALTSGRFRLADGSDLTYLADPAAEVEMGVVERPLPRSDIAPAQNLLTEAGVSADFSEPAEWDGAATLPAGITKVGSPAIAPSTDERYAEAGGVAMQVTAAEGEGFEAAVTLAPTSTEKYFSAWLAIAVVSGSARLELVDADGRSWPTGETAVAKGDLLQALEIAGLTPVAGAATLRVTALEAGTVIVVDAWTLVQLSAAYAYSPEMGPEALWHAAGALLAEEGGVPEDAFDGEVYDVSHLEAGDEIRIGTRVQAEETGAGVSLETRVVELERGGLGTEYQKRVTLSTSRRDLVDRLLGSSRPRRRIGSVVYGAAGPQPTPGGSVTASGSTLTCRYSGTVDEIQVDTPSGVKTFTGLSAAGGVVSYVAGTTALDDASTETALAAGEVRTGYRVTYAYGASEAVLFDGSLSGPLPDGAQKPTATLELSAVRSADADVAITGALGDGVTGAMEYSYRSELADITAAAWSGWAALPGGGAAVTVSRHVVIGRVVEAKVRDAAGRESEVVQRIVPAQLDAVDRDTGDLDAGRTKYLGGETVESLKPAESGAEQNPAGLETASCFGTWTGTGTTFSVSWTTRRANTTDHRIMIKYYRGGSMVGSTENIAINATQPYEITISGGSSGQLVSAVVSLTGASSGAIDTKITPETIQAL